MAWGWGDRDMVRGLEKALQYRHKAEEVMTIADALKSAEARKFLAGVASDYLKLAEALERMTEDPVPIPRPK
ncbi:MAG TPA: hypothetical protein VKB67_14555 [Rhizomicrobium sp.]|nr:hypothetical protein [Rhizomicrobium sp.]